MAQVGNTLYRYGGITYPFEDPDKMYVETYKNKNREYKELSFVDGLNKPGEIRVPMPDQPPLEQMWNYGIKKNDQVFERETTPMDFSMWPQVVRDAYVRNRWHLRRNGRWYLIGGVPVWLTGQCWMYNTYWPMEDGRLPTFRMESVEFFWAWHYVELSPNYFGMLDIKCRRLGDTEKGNFLAYELATRFARAWAGQQNLTEEDAKDNFLRLATSAKQMPFFFKPISNIESDPQTAIWFKFPGKNESRDALIRRKKLEQDISPDFLTADSKELGSRIDYGPSKPEHYDGKKLIYWMNDEPGKNKKMPPGAAWNVVRPCLALENETRIVGKAFMPTTVEDFESSATLANTIVMWNDANPKARDAKGRTPNGLLRYFRSAYLNGAVDKFGRCDSKQIDEDIDSKIANWMKLKKYQDIIDFKRKHPRTISEALLPPEGGCDLYPVLLDQRLLQLQQNLSWNDEEEKPRTIRGRLIFLGGTLSHHVEFIPDPNGKWLVCQHPNQPNLVSTVNGILVPGNATFVQGNDPIDYVEKQGKGSDGAIAVYRKFDPNVDSVANGIEWGEEDGRRIIMNPWKMKTDQFVALYTDRPDDGEEFFLEQAKACIYWGCKTLIESQRSTIITMMGQYKMDAFVMRRPSATITAQSTGRAYRGMPAGEGPINMYVDALKFHIKDRIATYHIKEQLEDFRQFTTDTRGKRDVTVASGMALLGAGGIKRQAETAAVATTNQRGLRTYKRIMA